jgi:hypothetical protein
VVSLGYAHSLWDYKVYTWDLKLGPCKLVVELQAPMKPHIPHTYTFENVSTSKVGNRPSPITTQTRNELFHAS